MLVRFPAQCPCQPKNVLFEFLLKKKDIGLRTFAFFEFLPRQKERFGMNNLIK